MSIDDILKKDVITVNPETKFGRVEKILTENNLTALAVTVDEKIRGIISMSDILKIKPHDYDGLAIKRYMQKHFPVIKNDTKIKQAAQIMNNYNLSILPVVEKEKFLGLIFKKDIKNYSNSYSYTFYGNCLIKINKKIFNIEQKLKNLPLRYINVINKVSAIFNKYNIKIYIVGGLVRDILLNKENRDLDFIYEGIIEPEKLREIIVEIVERLNTNWECNISFKTNTSFRTASIHFEQGLNLDFAALRREYYTSPGSLPEVKVANLQEDILRRDFTINTLVLDINPLNRGDVYDYIGGRKDLKKGLIRALHCYSFLDDPTRIIRGIRQSIELNFDIEEQTRKLIEDALLYGKFPDLTEERVFKELKLLFDRQINNKFIKLLSDLPVFNLLAININMNKKIVAKLYRLEDILAYFLERDYNVKDWLLRLAVIIPESPAVKLETWNISKENKEILSFHDYDKYMKKLYSAEKSSQLADVLNDLKLEKVILLMVEDENIVDKVKYYYEKLVKIELAINGNDLLKLGLKPGPEIKYILKEVWKAKVNGKLNNYRNEINYAKKLIRDKERS